jgi:alkylation response protein AidB-like acyl-CoA dehydrogenase
MELGLGGLLIPDAHGGAGLEMVDAAVIAEVLGRSAAPGPFLGHTLAGLAIALGGSDAQKKAWLPKLATGDALGTVALGEEGGLWAPEEWTFGGDSLTGTKAYVPYAAEADVIVVGVAGGGLALVEKDAPGLSATPFAGVDRTRRVATLAFDGTPAETLPGAGAAQRMRDAALVLLAADAFGGASQCVEMAAEYARTREQFGVTIGHFQALKHQLADLALDVEPARALYWFAAHAFDKEPEEAPRSAALAKAHITDRFMSVARGTVEAHGGIGYTWECDVQIWFKRAIFDRTFLGSPAVHRERVAQMGGW